MSYWLQVNPIQCGPSHLDYIRAGTRRRGSWRSVEIIEVTSEAGYHISLFSE